jgi:hypothetical protein
VERNWEERERLRLLAERLTEDDLRRKLPRSDWTIGDTLAHLAFYDRRAQILMEKFAREGITASPYDSQTINDALLPLIRRIPPRFMAEEAIAAAEDADRAAAALPDALLAEIRARGEVKPERYEHRKNHLDDIEAALAG